MTQEEAVAMQRADESTAWVDGRMLRKDMGDYIRVIIVSGGKVVGDLRADQESGATSFTPAILSWVGDRVSDKVLKNQRGFSAARPVVFNTLSGEVARRDIDAANEDEEDDNE